MGNPVVHFEIGVADPSRSNAFYSELFEWRIQADDSGHGLIDKGAGAGTNGGIMGMPQGTPAHVTVYVGVDDLETYLERAEALGGRTVRPRMPVGERGAFALLADPGQRDGALPGAPSSPGQRPMRIAPRAAEEDPPVLPSSGGTLALMGGQDSSERSPMPSGLALSHPSPWRVLGRVGRTALSVACSDP